MTIEGFFYQLITGRNLVDDSSAAWARQRQLIKLWQACQTNRTAAHFVGALSSVVDEYFVQMKRRQRICIGQLSTENEQSVELSEKLVPLDTHNLPATTASSAKTPDV